MKMESRSIDLISKQIYTCMSTLFFLISQKNKFARAAHFFFQISRKVICMCSTLFLCCCFARLKHQTSQLHIIFMDELSMCLPNILFREFMFALVFSMPLIFILLANSISHFLTASINFSSFNFFQQNSSPLFLITRSCSFSVIHMSRSSQRIFGKKIKDFSSTPFLQQHET